MRRFLCQSATSMACALVVSLLAGCSDQRTRAPMPPPPALGDMGGGGSTTAMMDEMIANGIFRPQYAFTLLRPKGWIEAPLPQAPYVHDLLTEMPLVPVRLLSGKGDVIQVEVSKVGKKDVKTHVAELIAAAKKREGSQEFEQSEMTVCARPTIRRVYSSDRAGERKTVAYYMVREGKCLALVCQTATDRFDEMKPVFEETIGKLMVMADGYSMTTTLGMPIAPPKDGPGGKPDPSRFGPGGIRGKLKAAAQEAKPPAAAGDSSKTQPPAGQVPKS